MQLNENNQHKTYRKQQNCKHSYSARDTNFIGRNIFPVFMNAHNGCFQIKQNNLKIVEIGYPYPAQNGPPGSFRADNEAVSRADGHIFPLRAEIIPVFPRRMVPQAVSERIMRLFPAQTATFDVRPFFWTVKHLFF